MSDLECRFDSLPKAGENWLDTDTRDTLRRVILTNGPRDILEIGSHRGRSAAFMLEQNPELHVTCVDIWKHDENYVAFEENLTTLGYRDRVIPIKTRSDDLMNHFKPKTFDMIFIDGAHDEETVYHDVLLAHSLLKPGRYIIGDDWNWPEVARGAVNAWAKIKEDPTKDKILSIYGNTTSFWILKEPVGGINARFT